MMLLLDLTAGINVKCIKTQFIQTFLSFVKKTFYCKDMLLDSQDAIHFYKIKLQEALFNIGLLFGKTGRFRTSHRRLGEKWKKWESPSKTGRLGRSVIIWDSRVHAVVQLY